MDRLYTFWVLAPMKQTFLLTLEICCTFSGSNAVKHSKCSYCSLWDSFCFWIGDFGDLDGMLLSSAACPFIQWPIGYLVWDCSAAMELLFYLYFLRHRLSGYSISQSYLNVEWVMCIKDTIIHWLVHKQFPFQTSTQQGIPSNLFQLDPLALRMPILK